MSRAAAEEPDDADDPLQRLVAACIEAHGTGGTAALEAVLAAHPELAEQARQKLAFLQRAGLLAGTLAQGGPALPESVGPYRILEPLGHGGMGTVYLAEQREPVRRKVALKLIKVGMDTREVVARFAAERQALALMNHAHIARVLDAGAAADGRPYFVMEYVPGLPITDYCDRQKLGSKQRLALFLAVCDGVQHAHLKGIIHRDLKPSNVLVTEQDGKPVPKIIDFGVAKAVGWSLTDATLHTSAGMVIGTPEYMSPEQATRDAIDIDTRSDVYSLGVLLYELLSGTLPFDSKRLRTDFVEMQRILREEDPRTPSQRLSTRDGTAQTAAQHRATEPAQLQRELRGDLDWICLEALEKERDRRYATVNDLAADIRRHLANEPVLAGPPSTWYRLSKFARRNRLQLAAAATVLVAVLVGLGLSLHYGLQARTAATTAENALRGETLARAAAEANFGRALDAVDRLLLHVASDKLADLPQMEEVRRSLLGDALAFYREFLQQRHDDPRTRYDAARAQIAVAGLSLELGDGNAALAAASDAEQTLRQLLTEHGDRLGVHLGLIEATFRRARAQVSLNSGDAAQASFDAAVEACQRARRELPTERQLDLTLSRGLSARAMFAMTRNVEAALADYRTAIDCAEAHADVDPAEAHRTARRARLGLCSALTALGRLDDAEGELVTLRTEVEAQRAQGPVDEETDELYARTLANLFFRRYASGDLDGAEELARLELSVRIPLVARQPRLPQPRRDLALTHSRLGIALSMAEKPGSKEEFVTGVSILEQLATEFPASTAIRASLAKESYNLGVHLLRAGVRQATEEAIPYAQRAVDLMVALRAGDGASKEWASSLASARTNLANLLLAAGRTRQARPIAEFALRDAQAFAERNPELTGNQVDAADAALAVAQVALDLGDARAAVAATDVGVAAMQRARSRSDEAMFRHTHALVLRLRAIGLARAGDHGAAAALVDEMLRLARDDRKVPIAAGDILRLAGYAAAPGSAERQAYAARARGFYADAVQGLAGDLRQNPTDGALRYLHAFARLGSAEFEVADDDPSAVVSALTQPLAVLRPEFEEGALDFVGRTQIRANYLRLVRALCALARFDEATHAAAELAAISVEDADWGFSAASLLARCASGLARSGGQEAAAHARSAAVGALQHAVDAGFADAGRIDEDLEAACVDSDGRAVLARLRRGR